MIKTSTIHCNAKAANSTAMLSGHSSFPSNMSCLSCRKN